MKAVSPVRHPSRKALAGGGGGCCCGDGGGGVGVEVPVRCLADAAPGCLKGSPPSAQEEQEDRAAAAAAAAAGSLCLQCDMNDCYSRLRKLVPTIPPNKRVSKVEILQHVIDYILDLQLALETHPALLRQQQQQAPMQPPPPPGSVLLPAGPPRTPLSTLNADPVRLPPPPPDRERREGGRGRAPLSRLSLPGTKAREALWKDGRKGHTHTHTHILTSKEMDTHTHILFGQD
ncbi:DNA-binding protein inhibitor ID-4 [Sceloporus undulatus]|uniref:DNA-binding protein inhibitor ID-4 n=1 Tax=Sceloporus undulatus TaxID=8520 RepID=UPI001C4CAEF4|nr:DNA-binding protein inhibitor ID-4 [Sceloporus undulatus]